MDGLHDDRIAAPAPEGDPLGKALRFLDGRLAELEERLMGELRNGRVGESTQGQEAMFTVRDLAEFLRCDPRSVHRWWREGAIPPPVKVGSSLRWYRPVLRDWLQEKGVDPRILDQRKR